MFLHFGQSWRVPTKWLWWWRIGRSGGRIPTASRFALPAKNVKSKIQNQKIKSWKKIGFRRRADTFHKTICKARKKQSLITTIFEPNEELPSTDAWIFLFVLYPWQYLKHIWSKRLYILLVSLAFEHCDGFTDEFWLMVISNDEAVHNIWGWRVGSRCAWRIHLANLKSENWSSNAMHISCC